MKRIILLIFTLAFSFGVTSTVFAQKSIKRMKKNQQTQIAKISKPVPEPNKVLEKTEIPTNVSRENNPANENLTQAAIPPNWKLITLDLKPKPVEESVFDKVLSGNVSVDISQNGNTFIKVGLAERAVALIDFPADDPVYKIHPGNENYVTVGCFGREPNGKCLNSPTDAIVLRPGKDFHSMGDQESVSTVITIQRVSGIVVTIFVVPVKSLAENTNYVAVKYSTKEIVEARQKAGLAVNLVPEGVINPSQTVKAKEKEANQNSQNGEKVTVDGLIRNNQADDSSKPTEKNDTSGDNKNQSIQEILEAEIQRVAANSSAYKFSKPNYGISLARATGEVARVNDVTVEVIAVRNTLGYPIRLVSDQPELAIENKDAKDTSINVEKINLLHIATTADDTDVLEPGRIYYYAIAYQTPILGVRQVLRVSFAQREAADAPATLELVGISR